MSLSLKSIKCPECNANLEFEEGRSKMFCSYCGTPIILTNDNEYIYHHIDDAEIKHAETEQMIKLRQMEMDNRSREAAEKRKNIKFKISIALGIVGVLSIFIGFMANAESFGMVGMLALTILMYMNLSNIGKHEEDTSIDGKIKIPPAAFYFNNKNYQVLLTTFRNAGFMNVKCIPLNDLTTGIISKPNTIESISIGGQIIQGVNPNTRFFPDVNVVITYHSFRGGAR